LRRNYEGQWLVRTRDGEVALAPGDRSWVLHTPADKKRPWATAPWRACARWWLLSQYARQDLSKHSQRAAGFIAVAPPAPTAVSPKVDDDARKVQKRRLAEDLSEMGRSGSIVLPAGYDARLIQAAANTHQTFVAQMELASAGITIALSGQNLTTQVKGGSLSAASVHERVERTLLIADANSRARTLHDQVLVHWAAYNLRGGARAAPWPTWDTTPPEDLAATGLAWNSALDAMAKAEELGLEIDEKDVARRFRVPLRRLANPRVKPPPKGTSDAE
jgi:phage gp29-like protein